MAVCGVLSLVHETQESQILRETLKSICRPNRHIAKHSINRQSSEVCLGEARGGEGAGGCKGGRLT